MELKEGAIIANRFRLERLLGKGGMGDVWAAQHTALDIPCAVKFIHSESADKPEVRERFEREAKAAAALRSPNVVQILDYGIADGNVPYLAMEYLEGEPLNVRLRRRGRLDAVETCRIIAGIGRALTRAHAAGIVHRDLKPENVFLVPDEDGEVAKVLDFGVAKVTNQLDSNTRTGALLGTPYYMSPEQAQGVKAVDTRADLWSLAVVAFRCVTGQLPFKSDALGDLLIRIVTQAPPVPSHVCPGLPDAFDRWWARASQREPDHRYQTAKELTDALALALGISLSTNSTHSSFGGYQPLSPLQQTVAIPEMNTPLPGANFGGVSHGLPPAYGAPHVPSGPGYGAAAAGNSGGYPYQGAYTPQLLGDSQGSASVVGMATGHPIQAAGRKKTGALVLVLGLALVVGGLAAFFMFKSGSATTTAASASPRAAASPAETVLAPQVTATATLPPAATATETATATATATANATATA